MCTGRKLISSDLFGDRWKPDDVIDDGGGGGVDAGGGVNDVIGGDGVRVLDIPYAHEQIA